LTAADLKPKKTARTIVSCGFFCTGKQVVEKDQFLNAK